MHSFEWNQRADAFAPHRFKRAARVAHSVFREAAANRVSNPAGQPLQQSVPPFRTIAADEIGAALNLGKKFWNVSWIILQIAVDENHRWALGGLEPGIDRRALPGILFKPDHANVRLRLNTFNCAIA